MKEGANWVEGLKAYVAECRASRPIVDRKDLSTAEEMQCRIIGDSLISGFGSLLIREKTTDANPLPMNLIISSLEDMLQFNGKVSHVLSIVDPDEGLNIPTLGVPLDRRLVLLCDDVDSRAEAQSREQQMPGSRCIAPTRTMVKRGLAFAKGVPDQATLVHCGQGVSRSTAMAFAILCQAQPNVSEDEVFQQVLRLRPQSYPNALIVKHADGLWGRNGRMCRAIGSA